MNVNAVSFGQNQVKSTQPKESNPVRTGAKIGAVASSLILASTVAVPSSRKTFFEGLPSALKSMQKGKAAACIAAGTAVSIAFFTCIGAAVGSVFKSANDYKNHKAEKAEAPEKK